MKQQQPIIYHRNSHKHLWALIILLSLLSIYLLKNNIDKSHSQINNRNQNKNQTQVQSQQYIPSKQQQQQNEKEEQITNNINNQQDNQNDKQDNQQIEQRIQRLQSKKKRQKNNQENNINLENLIDASYKSSSQFNLSLNIQDSKMKSTVSHINIKNQQIKQIVFNSYIQQFQHLPIILDFSTSWSDSYIYKSQVLRGQYILQKNDNYWSQITSLYKLGYDLTKQQFIKQLIDQNINEEQIFKDQQFKNLIAKLKPKFQSLQYEYKFKVINTKNGQISFGLVTSQGLDQQDCSDTQALYYYGHFGQVLIDDKWIDLGGQILTPQMIQQSPNKQVQIKIQIDLNRKQISWYFDDRRQSSTSFPSYFLENDIYLLIQMNNNGDKIQLIQPQEWIAVQKKLQYLIADLKKQQDDRQQAQKRKKKQIKKGEQQLKAKGVSSDGNNNSNKNQKQQVPGNKSNKSNNQKNNSSTLNQSKSSLDL